MSFISEFKEFAMKGNVVDMAVGVIIGAAFGKIVSSLVSDVVTPPLGFAIGGVNFTDLAVTLGTGPTGEPIVLKYGAFLQAAFDFLIIAFVLFLAIRAINKLKTPPAPAAAAPPSRQEVLLQEIRDLLARK
ncbi:MAG TPA: large-conductance mechanosensitive channel protein MscL [Steroidobacteraceae bacterium]|nr:large-conductance mechanosensitive channel protein MscL [Steroidobacteraceae bacterium]